MDRYFFIHIQKTAGTSLRRHLLANFNREEIYPPPPDGGSKNQMLSAYLAGGFLCDIPPDVQARFRLFHGHMAFAVSKRLSFDEPMKTFTLLRDPVERTLSVLGQKKRNRPEFAKASLEQIYDNEEIFPGQILNHQTKIFAVPVDSDILEGFRPFHVGEEEFERAKKHLEMVDVIGIQEDMPAFLRALSSRFGWTILDEDVRENVGNKQKVSPGLRQRIAEDNAIDIEFYRYARQLIEQRGQN